MSRLNRHEMLRLNVEQKCVKVQHVRRSVAEKSLPRKSRECSSRSATATKTLFTLINAPQALTSLTTLRLLQTLIARWCNFHDSA